MNGLSKVLVCLTLFATACGGDSTAPRTTTIAGSYVLRTVNGSPLPYLVAEIGADKLEWLNETVTLSEGGTFTQQGSFRLTQNGVVSTESHSDTGSYTRNGTAISFYFNSDGSSPTGTVSGNTITVAFSGYSLVYHK